MDSHGTLGGGWDARSWLLRVAVVASVTVLAVTAELPPATTRTVGLAAGLLWVPLISMGIRVHRRWPGSLPATGGLLVDLVALATTGLLVGPLAVPCAVAVAAVAAVHGLRAERVVRTTAVALGVVTQVLLLADVGLPATVVAADLAVSAVWLLAAGDRDAHRRRTREDLAHVGRLTDAVLAGVGEAVVVTGDGGRLLSSNAAAETTFGHPVGGSCHAALQLEHATGPLDCRRGCPLLADDGSAAQVEVHRTHPSGRSQALLANVRAVRDPLGRIGRVVHSFRDITALRQADEAKRLFLATASHELKTPLTVIGGFAELLRDRDLDPELRARALDAILTRTRQLNTIVDRLLMAGRVEGGAVDLRVGPVAPGPVVTERASSTGTGLGREVHLEVSPDLPDVLAEPVALATVVEHLVENAVKYSPDGGPVRVVVDVDDQQVHVDVTDRGVGMTAQDAAQCFEPFWQAEAVESRRFGGSGVGLYVVRSLVLGMGGEVSVAWTEPGAGSTLRVSLRRADRTPDDDAEPVGAATTAVDEWMRQIGVGTGS